MAYSNRYSQKHGYWLTSIFQKNLANIVIKYVDIDSRNYYGFKSAARDGQYEMCLQFDLNVPIDQKHNIINEILVHACYGGHIDIVKYAISHGADNWNNGLYGACSSGDAEIAQLMISKGAND